MRVLYNIYLVGVLEDVATLGMRKRVGSVGSVIHY